MGEGSDAALHGTPAGGLKPSTEAAVKKELQQSVSNATMPLRPPLVPAPQAKGPHVRACTRCQPHVYFTAMAAFCLSVPRHC